MSTHLRYLCLVSTLVFVAGGLAAQSTTGVFPPWTGDATISGNPRSTNQTALSDFPGLEGSGSFSRGAHEPAPNFGEPEGLTATPRPGENGPISTDQLRHPLKGKALRMIQKAESLIQAGDHAHAIEELRRDVANSEAAPYAHSLLGQEYIRSLRYGEAVAELQEAVRLLPSNVTDHANLGYALLMTSRLVPAERELLRALELQPKNPHTHLALGMLRYSQGPSHDQEAREHLEFAAAELPGARLMLAKFYSRTGSPEAAEREFQAYLKATGVTDNALLRQWLQQGTLTRAGR